MCAADLPVDWREIAGSVSGGDEIDDDGVRAGADERLGGEGTFSRAA